MSTELSEIFNETPEPTQTLEPDKTQEPQESIESEPQEPEKPEVEAAVPADTESKKAPATVPVSALRAERQRRQELERRVAEIEAKNQPALPDPLEDAEAYNTAISERVSAQVAAEVAKRSADMDKAAKDARFEASKAVHEQAVGSEAIKAAEDAFLEAANSDPSLVTKIGGEVDPYGFVLKWHDRQRLMSEIGDDPGAYRKKIEEQVRTQIAAEGRSQTPAPPSLANTPSGTGTKEWKGPTPLEDIFKG